MAIIAGAIVIAARTNGSLQVCAGTWFFGSMLLLGATALFSVIHSARGLRSLPGRRPRQSNNPNMDGPSHDG